MKRSITCFVGLGLILIAGSSGNCQADKSTDILQPDTLLSGSVTPLLTYSNQPKEDSTEKKLSEDFTTRNNQNIKKAKKFCSRAKPKPECASFLITEFGYAYRFDHSPHNQQYLTWELGWMINRNKRSAVGATVLFGLDQGFEELRFALKPRFRWRLTKTESLDFAPGLVFSGPKNETFRFPSFTGHVAFSLEDFLLLTGQVEVTRRAKTGTDVAWYAGFKLGTPVGAITGTAVAVVIGLFSLASSFSGGPVFGG